MTMTAVYSSTPCIRKSTVFADEQRCNFGPVQNSAATNRQSNPGPDEEAAKHRCQKFVGRHVRIFEESKTERQPSDSQRASNCEAPADLAIAERNEGKINRQD